MQKLSSDQFEVIVVDLGNDKATAAVAQEISTLTDMTIRYISQRRDRTEAAAYNRGWKLANGLIVAFTRDSCLPQSRWLTTALPLFHNGAQVVVGRTQYSLPVRPASISAATNLFCRRTLLDKIGGFDEWLGPKKSYEVDWFDKLAKAAIPVTSCTEAIVSYQSRKITWYSALRIALSNLF